jgi:hypothetical protein
MFCCLLDTGAQLCLLNQSTFNKLQSTDEDIQLLECKEKISVIGDGKTHVLGLVILDLKIFKDDISQPLPFVIVEDDCIPYWCVLGEHFLSQRKIILDFDKQIISSDQSSETRLLANV